MSEPMSFMHLNMLADVLYRDLEELASDFETKSQFCKEQEQKCIDNAKNVLSVDQIVNSLNCCMLRLEMDLNENESNLIEVEKTVSHLERTCQSDSEYPPCRVYPLARATYEDLLEQLLATEKTAVQWNNIRAQIEELRQEALDKLAPRNLVTHIINYHTATMDSIDKQIKHFESQINQLEADFERLTEEKKAVKCPCQLTAADEAMDIS